MNKTTIMLFTFLMFNQTATSGMTIKGVCYSQERVSKFWPTLTACITLPLSAFFFYRGMQAFDERQAITKSIPGLEDCIKDLQKVCAEYKDPIDDDIGLRIHWTNLYDLAVRRYDPELADKLLELRTRETRYMIPGFLLALVGISTGVAALSDSTVIKIY